MIIFPAIDLKQGSCVRLEQGDMDRVTVFNDNPVSQAKEFAQQGFKHLHLVDLNGAFEGGAVNAESVEKILAAKRDDIFVQLGGGIRDLKTIAFWLEKGLSRVILGTVAVQNPDLVKEACRLFPDKVAVGIDARSGYVAVEGWAESSNVKALDLAKQFEDSGVSAIIYTDIDRDGMLQGVNLGATLDLARAVSIPVIASGGVSCVEDIVALQNLEAEGVSGVISGRALYDGRINIPELLNLEGVI